MKSVLLHIEDLAKVYHGVAALKGISFKVYADRIVALMGPNGAGKTTVLDLVSGLERASGGRVHYKGADITGVAAHRIARMGIARTYQASQVFGHLSVIENIMVGRYQFTRVPFWLAGLWWPSVYREEHRNLTKSFEILDFVGLYEKADRRIDQISYREQKLVELGRCLAMEPELLLLDEPFGGLNRDEIKSMAEKIQQIGSSGTTIVLIDHHFDTVFDLSDHIVVLNEGAVVAMGKPEVIRGDEEVKRAYLDL